MSKLLLGVKNVILFIVLGFNILFLIKCGIESYKQILYLFLFIVIIFTSIKDFIKKDQIIYNKKYNLLSIFALSIMLIIFTRCFYDPMFIRDKDFISIVFSGADNEWKYSALYVSQNYIYFIIMIASLIVYRFINKSNKEFPYSYISVLCFVLSVCSILPTFINLSETYKSIIFLIYTIILVGVEIEELIRNNGKKKEWIIYFSFVFNLLAFLSFIINR